MSWRSTVRHNLRQHIVGNGWPPEASEKLSLADVKLCLFGSRLAQIAPAACALDAFGISDLACVIGWYLPDLY